MSAAASSAKTARRVGFELRATCRSVATLRRCASARAWRYARMNEMPSSTNEMPSTA